MIIILIVTEMIEMPVIVPETEKTLSLSLSLLAVQESLIGDIVSQ